MGAIFGKPAHTTPLPAKLANRNNTPVVMFTAKRKALGQGWLTHATRLPPFSEDPTQAAAELNVAIENAALLGPNNLFDLTTVTSTPLAQNHRRATDTIFFGMARLSNLFNFLGLSIPPHHRWVLDLEVFRSLHHALALVSFGALHSDWLARNAYWDRRALLQPPR